MGNFCSDSCKRKDEAAQQHALRVISSLPYLTQFKSKRAIVDTHYVSLPLSTDGARIVDSFGRRVKLCCYNLKGCHSIKACVSALEQLSIDELATQIKKEGFNTVIIPFSLDVFFENPRIENQCLGKNTWMKNKKALEILDITINGLTKSGLLVMLRNACSKASYFKEFTQSDGLWWSQKYPEQKWIECLKGLTSRYKHNPRVFGMQIRHTLKKTPNHQPSWGSGNKLCDWKRAAGLACNGILSQNPNMIVVITGDQRGDLRDISQDPLELIVKNKLVFAAKLKPFAQKPKSFQQLKTYFDQSLNCIRNTGYPLILATVTDRKQSDWKYLIDLLQQTDLDWGYSSYPKSHIFSTHQLFSNQQIIPDLKRIQISTCGQQQMNKSMDQTQAQIFYKQIQALRNKRSAAASTNSDIDKQQQPKQCN